MVHCVGGFLLRVLGIILWFGVCPQFVQSGKSGTEGQRTVIALLTRYLERRGHVVLEPDFLASEIAYVNIGPFTVSRCDAPYKAVPAHAQIVPPGMRLVPADARLVPPGCVVKRPEHAPEVGSVHAPACGNSEPRTVVGVMGDEVTYRTATRERAVKVGSFNDWRRDTQAEESRNG